jgi:plasmid stabilization system protein ParE
MPQGDKSAYSDKQKRQAEHIEESYEDRGVSNDEAERRAWATVNKSSGGGKKADRGAATPKIPNHHTPAGKKVGRLRPPDQPKTARRPRKKRLPPGSRTQEVSRVFVLIVGSVLLKSGKTDPDFFPIPPGPNPKLTAIQSFFGRFSHPIENKPGYDYSNPGYSCIDLTL